MEQSVTLIDALSPIILFIFVHYLNLLPKILSKNSGKFLSEYLAGFSTAFLIFARGSWILYFRDEIGVDVNYIIFFGTVIQGVFSSYSVKGCGSPLGLYHQKFLELAKNEKKKKKISGLEILREIGLDIIIQIIGHTHGALFAIRYLFFYSPLATHSKLFSSSDNNFQTSISDQLIDKQSVFSHFIPTFYETFSILCLMITSTLVDQIFQISKNQAQLKKLQRNGNNIQNNKISKTQKSLQDKLNSSQLFSTFFLPFVVASFVLFSVEATGAQLNPALAFGMNYRALMYGTHPIGRFYEFVRHVLVFWVYPFVGVHVFSWVQVEFLLRNDSSFVEKKRHSKMVQKIKKSQ